MQNKLTIAAIIFVAGFLSWIIVSTKEPVNDTGIQIDSAKTATGSGSATIEDGVQYIDITAQGGYSPRVTKAQAGVPTIIRMKTQNTYDCSAALVIPDLKYQSFLSPTSVEEITVPADKAKGTLRGMCSMAMYHFQIDFE